MCRGRYSRTGITWTISNKFRRALFHAHKTQPYNIMCVIEYNINMYKWSVVRVTRLIDRNFDFKSVANSQNSMKICLNHKAWRVVATFDFTHINISYYCVYFSSTACKLPITENPATYSHHGDGDGQKVVSLFVTVTVLFLILISLGRRILPDNTRRLLLLRLGLPCACGGGGETA